MEVEKKWMRQCPKCNVEIFHTAKHNRDRLEKIGSLCQTCKKLGASDSAKKRETHVWNKSTDTKWFRNCPKCDRILYYSSRGGMYKANVKNSLCMYCKNTFTDEQRQHLSNKLKGKYHGNNTRSPGTKSGPHHKLCPNCNGDMYYSRHDKLVKSIRENTLCNSCSSYVYKKNWVNVIKPEHIQKMAAKKAGYATYDEYMADLDSKTKYRRAVHNITKKQDISQLANADKVRGLCGVDGAYQLDHIISITEGYKRNIPPDIIGHISNLQIIPWKDNLRKNRDLLTFLEWIETLSLNDVQYGFFESDETTIPATIYVPTIKLAIDFIETEYEGEFNGGQHRRDGERKIELCQKDGIRLLQVWDIEWENHPIAIQTKLKHILQIRETVPIVGGRNIVIKKLCNKEDREFLTLFHNQGYTTSQIRYGAFHKTTDELIAVMTFSVPRPGMSGKSTEGYELVRYATHAQYRCPGIFSKIFEQFKEEYTPSLIYSFASRRYSQESNNVYEKSGFVLDRILPPSYAYVKDGVVAHRSKFMKKNLIKMGYDASLSEREIVQQMGWERIWEPGHLRYIWKG